MLNKNADSGHPCPVPVLREKGVRFLPLSILLAVDLSYTAFIILSTFPLYSLYTFKYKFHTEAFHSLNR